VSAARGGVADLRASVQSAAAAFRQGLDLFSLSWCLVVHLRVCATTGLATKSDRAGTRALVDCQPDADLGAKGRPDGPCQEHRLSRDGCR